MQNRLDAAREARAASERQLAEVQAAIAAERAARPESVRSARIFLNICGFLLTTVILSAGRTTLHAVIIGTTHGGTDTPRGHDEGASRAADRARRVWRV